MSGFGHGSRHEERPIRFAILHFSLLVLGAASGFATGIGEVLGNIAASAVLLAGLASMYKKRIAHAAPVGTAQIASQLIYFSFCTLTTVGFGDITPLTPPAKSFAMIEAVVGPIFVAVFLARLVGIRTSSH